MPRKSKFSQDTIYKLLEHFIVETTARSTAVICIVSRETATHWFHKFREIIFHNLSTIPVMFDGEVEVDEFIDDVYVVLKMSSCSRTFSARIEGIDLSVTKTRKAISLNNKIPLMDMSIL